MVFRTPLIGLAQAYARLAGDALPEPYQQAGLCIRAVIAAAPELIAGPGRLCTDLMQVESQPHREDWCHGVYCLATVNSANGPCGLALQDRGWQYATAVPACLQSGLGARLADAGLLQRIHSHWHMPLINHQKELVGDIHVTIDD